MFGSQIAELLMIDFNRTPSRARHRRAAMPEEDHFMMHDDEYGIAAFYECY